MASQKLKLDLNVPNELAPEGGEMAVSLKVSSLKDLEPEAVARQVPALAKMLEQRGSGRTQGA